MEICDIMHCTGCGLCLNLCPLKCIEMKEDEFGFLYPKIDDSKCVECGLCRSRCPVNSKPESSLARKAYAAWSLNEKEHESSSSGGIASVISRKIISEGGVVYGCALTENRIEHIRVDNECALSSLKGSKYVQSLIHNIYETIKSDLNDGKKVLFIGTPCQCAGVKAYIGEECGSLYLISLICMGVPPQKLMWEELGYIDTKPQKISFREGDKPILTVIDNDEVVYRKPSYRNLYYKGFYARLCLRESCYNCSFKGMERCSDLSIGDFLKLGRMNPFEHEIKNGVSVVMPHTEKGEMLISACEEELFLEERMLGEVVRYNPMYSVSTKKHRNSDKFKKIYVKKGMVNATRRTLIKEIICSFAYHSLERVYKKIKKI